MRIERLTHENLEKVVELTDMVFRPNTRTMRQETPIMWSEENIRCGFSRVLVIDDKVVSFVGAVLTWAVLDGKFIPVLMIGNVATHPDYRGRGYASMLLKEVLKEAYNQGVALVYISGDHGLYRAAGGFEANFRQALLVSDGKIRTEEVNSSQAELDGLVVRPYRSGDFPALFGLYQGERYKFVRNSTVFKYIYDLYGLPLLEKVMEAATRTYVIEKDGAPVAYFTVGRRNDEEWVGGNFEFAGDRQSLAKVLLSFGTGKKRVISNLADPIFEEFRKLRNIESGRTYHWTLLCVNEENFKVYMGAELGGKSAKEAISDGKIVLPTYGFNYV